MKTGIRIIFVSTGRCGTTRLAEILRQYLPDNCTVVHQTRFSQIANVLGNIQYHFTVNDKICDFFYYKMFRSLWIKGRNFISVDPLSPMIVPSVIIKSDKTYIIHLYRDSAQFSESMFRLTRQKKKSFVAHNFIPFWQPYLLPLENIFSKKILNKYCYIHDKKNKYFEKKFSMNPHYQKIFMQDVFQNETLSHLFSDILKEKIEIPEYELLIKKNQTSA